MAVHSCASLHRLSRPRVKPVAHQWVHNRVKSAPVIGIRENKLTQPPAVDVAFDDELLAKLADDGREARGARFVDGVGGLVGVHHDRAKLVQH